MRNVTRAADRFNGQARQRSPYYEMHTAIWASTLTLAEKAFCLACTRLGEAGRAMHLNIGKLASMLGLNQESTRRIAKRLVERGTIVAESASSSGWRGVTFRFCDAFLSSATYPGSVPNLSAIGSEPIADRFSNKETRSSPGTFHTTAPSAEKKAEFTFQGQPLNALSDDTISWMLSGQCRMVENNARYKAAVIAEDQRRDQEQRVRSSSRIPNAEETRLRHRWLRECLDDESFADFKARIAKVPA